jgi:hypothetical protein
MEGIIGNFENAQAQFSNIVGTVIALLIAWAVIKWSHKGYLFIQGMLKERNVSKQTMRTRKKKEAKVVSDGAILLLKECKEQGLLTDAGVLYWKKKLESIGLDLGVEEPNLLGKMFSFPVTHSMRDLGKYLSLKRKKKEDKDLIVHLD